MCGDVTMSVAGLWFDLFDLNYETHIVVLRYL